MDNICCISFIVLTSQTLNDERHIRSVVTNGNLWCIEPRAPYREVMRLQDP